MNIEINVIKQNGIYGINRLEINIDTKIFSFIIFQSDNDHHIYIDTNLNDFDNNVTILPIDIVEFLLKNDYVVIINKILDNTNNLIGYKLKLLPKILLQLL